MKTIDFSYFIERYNAGEMSNVEKQWFQKELEGNKKLRDEVEFRKKTDLALKNHDIIQLRSKLAEIEKKRATEVSAKSPGKNINMKYAAVIAALVLLGSLALFTGRNLNIDEIFDRYYKSYETPSGIRSEQIQVVNDYTTAIEYYNIHDYRMAAIYFNKVLESSPEDMEITLLYGVSNFELENYPIAKQSFSKVINENSNLYIEDARWYLALCYLKTDERTQAVAQLKNIGESNSIYRKDARKILRKMK